MKYVGFQVRIPESTLARRMFLVFDDDFTHSALAQAAVGAMKEDGVEMEIVSAGEAYPSEGGPLEWETCGSSSTLKLKPHEQDAFLLTFPQLRIQEAIEPCKL